MQAYNQYVRIANGDPVKLARMLEIQSWFDNKDQLAAMATSMAKYRGDAREGWNLSSWLVTLAVYFRYYL